MTTTPTLVPVQPPRLRAVRRMPAVGQSRAERRRPGVRGIGATGPFAAETALPASHVRRTRPPPHRTAPPPPPAGAAAAPTPPPPRAAKTTGPPRRTAPQKAGKPQRQIEISRISKWIVPAGTSTSTRSPFFLPRSALAMGVPMASLPSRRFASFSDTIV